MLSSSFWRTRSNAGVLSTSIDGATNLSNTKRQLLLSIFGYAAPCAPFISFQDYIACKGDHATYLPHTAGRYQQKRFRKASCPIVERLACCLMRKGRNSGKKLMACRIVQHTLEIIHLLTDQNPIQVVVDAIINSGPREDSTRVGGAGVVRRQAVDMSPFRRVNYALYLIATGAREASFRNLKTMAECLAEELINAARGSSNSYAIKKKDEIERVSKSNR
jgi:small subunit ribosomal protein S5e